MAYNQSNDDEDPVYVSPDMQMPETKDWDAFKDPPRKLDQGSEADSKWMDIVITTSKILTYIVVFCLILGTAILSKGTLLFMTSQIKKNVTRPFCNKKHDINQQFVVTIPEVERTAWIWMLVFAYFVPEVGTFIRSVRILSFKSWTRPSIWEFMTVALSETLTAIGSAILVFVVLPELDVVKGAMLTNAVCFIPSVLGLLTTKPGTLDSAMKITLDALSCLAQLTGLIVWPVIEKRSSLYMIPVSVLLISAGWWENYVSSESSIPFIRQLGIKKRIFENGRYFIFAFVSLWKCIVFFVTLLIILMVKEDGYHFIFSNMADAFSEHKINITSVKPVIDLSAATINYSEAIAAGTDLPITTNQYAPLYVWIVNIIATYFCYGIAKFSYKVIIQGFSFAFPINLAVPVLLSALIAMCGAFVKDECAYFGTIPSYLFFNSPPLYLLRDFISQQCSWIWLIWLLSQAWITVHIWSPSCEKLASTEKLFVKPVYDAFLIDQSLALNKRREEVPTIAALSSGEINTNNSDYTTKIYACGTMWHETKEEMMEFLKSIMRLDADQCANRIVRTHFNMNLPSYYELETHVFFDDAYIRTSQDDPDPHVNQFVLDLVSIIDEAASQVHQTAIKVRPPVIYSTPYGGRLIWTLPGKTQMIAHLKDKKKIRAKKRWSQVMYMYYLLGYKLMADQSISEESKNIKAENTYILALDGDIDFQPQAVQLLVDYMKKNKSLGAACGRIHPIGSGAMAWYQMFEYAVGHWMQKATEHVFGCVLCSPGCFSLFRGKALMDDCVMNKYTTKASEAVHYVQYDQGEDRWLCTLLLQRGYRVEYSAASDAYTHCPEGFNEFYNQRRRWMPSTTANILDLLMDYKHTVKINDNISMLYIGYQGLLMIGTALGPGTIFLMLVGAFVAAFQLDQWTSFIWNIVPILIFVIVCATCKSDTQLFFAGIISAIYGLIMMAVLVGVLLEINNDGILAPSSLFFFCIAGEFIIAGLLHPKEFNCLKYGIIYYVTVPSMYMLLVIYSVFNMNNVSWGTREVTIIQKPKATNEKKEAEKEEEPKKKENKVLSFLGANKKDNEGSIEFSISSMFRCMLCTHQKHSDELDRLHDIKDSLNSLNKKLDVLEMNVYRRIDLLDRANNSGEPEFTRNNSELRRNTSFSRKGTTHVEGARASRVHFDRQVSQMRLSVSGDIEEEEISDSNSQPSDEVTENSWFYDGDLIRGEVDFIPKREEMFWNGLLDKYLHPIDDTENKDRIAKELKDLRDKMVFTFFMINALFVLVVFLLTLKKDLLHINWPVAPKTNFTYVPDENEVLMYRKYLQLEPIGFVFLIFFALLLVIQFMGMIVHRFATFSQIIVNTRIDWEFFQKNVENMSGEEVLEQDPLKIAKALAKLKGLTSSEPEKLEPVARRNTVLLRAQSIKAPQRPINDLEKAFERRLTQFENNSNAELPIRRDTMAAVRRKTMEIKPRQIFSYSPGEAES